MYLETKYIINGNTTVGVIEVIEVGEYLVPAENLIYKTANFVKYDRIEQSLLN